VPGRATPAIDAAARIDRAARLRGLWRGDLPALDDTRGALSRARDGDEVEALRRAALAHIAAFVPDPAFVQRKRERLARRAADADALTRALVARHIATADEAAGRSALVDANTALNLGFAALDTAP
jgi:hypothetical protein